MGLANWLKPLVLAAKYSCGMFLIKNECLGELRNQKFIAFLMVDWICYSLVTVKDVVHREDYGLEFCGGTCLEVWQRKQ